LLVAALAACGSPSSEDTNPTPIPSGTPADLSQRSCPTGAPETYVNFGAPFMEDWCTGCHSSHLTGADRKDAPVGFDFDTLGGIRAHMDRIYLRAGDGYATMPAVGTVDTNLRFELGDWLACGAP
jgi:cytochrome c5